MKTLYHITYDVIDSFGNWERRKTFFTFAKDRFDREMERLKKQTYIIIISYTED